MSSPIPYWYLKCYCFCDCLGTSRKSKVLCVRWLVAMNCWVRFHMNGPGLLCLTVCLHCSLLITVQYSNSCFKSAILSCFISRPICLLIILSLWLMHIFLLFILRLQTVNCHFTLLYFEMYKTSSPTKHPFPLLVLIMCLWTVDIEVGVQGNTLRVD